MKSLRLLRLAPLSLLLLVTSCAHTLLTFNETRATGTVFREKNNSDLVLEYYRPDTIYMKQPDAHEGPFLTIFNRENITTEIMHRVKQHNLAVVVIGHFHDMDLESALFQDWESLLGSCGFRRVVFLRAGLATRIDGLPIIRDTIVAAQPSIGSPVTTVAVNTTAH